MTFSTRGLTSNLSREHRFEPLPVTGTVPSWLRGTLFRNGPGLQERFGRRYDHLFEGDGAIAALRLGDGEALGAHRVIRSAGFVAEETAGRHLGSLAAPWPVRLWTLHRGTLKNTANTSVVSWQGRLLALMEGDKPVEIDPATLDTLGETDLDCIGGAFSAHPHRVASRNATFNFGLRYGRHTHLDLFVLPDRGPARRLGSVPLPQPVMLHDFVATDDHLVFFVSPLQLVVWRMMLALRPFHRNFRWQGDAGTEVIVIPIDHPERVTRFSTPAFFQWHFANAFDDGDDIVVDYVRYPDAASFPDMADMEEVSFHDPRLVSSGRLHRARVRPSSEALVSEARSELACEFPTVLPARSGQRHDRTWVQTEAFVDGVVRFGVAHLGTAATERWFEPGEQCGEPVPVASPDGRDDVVIVLVYDGRQERSRWEILDGRTLTTRATVWLPHAVPITFHGQWVPAR